MEPSGDDEPTCRCGETRGSATVVEDPHYSGIDYLWMLVGVSSRPVPYEVKCAVCGPLFELTEPRRPW